MSETVNWFRRRRKEIGLSQPDVVYAFAQRGQKLTASAVSGWEAGQVPSMSYVDHIAAVYQVAAEEVLRVMHEMTNARNEAAAAK